MKSVLINVEKKSNIACSVSLAKRPGLSAKPITRSEIEDWKFAQIIEKGMKSPNVSRIEVMKAFGK